MPDQSPRTQSMKRSTPTAHQTSAVRRTTLCWCRERQPAREPRLGRAEIGLRRRAGRAGRGRAPPYAPDICTCGVPGDEVFRHRRVGGFLVVEAGRRQVAPHGTNHRGREKHPAEDAQLARPRRLDLRSPPYVAPCAAAGRAPAGRGPLARSMSTRRAARRARSTRRISSADMASASARSSGSCVAASESACSGSGWTSRKRPSAPAATAARASGSAKRRQPAALGAAAGELERVGDVVDHRDAVLVEHGEAAHVDHQVVVAEGDAALGDGDPVVAGRRAPSRRRWRMSSGAMNCPFLMLTARPVARRGHHEVGLAAEEGGDLEHVADLGRRRALRPARGRR